MNEISSRSDCSNKTHQEMMKSCNYWSLFVDWSVNGWCQSVFLKAELTSSNLSRCPQQDIQFTVIEEERNQKMSSNRSIDYQSTTYWLTLELYSRFKTLPASILTVLRWPKVDVQLLRVILKPYQSETLFMYPDFSLFPWTCSREDMLGLLTTI